MKIGVGSRTARPVARAEAVGSLLRPKAITDLFDKIYEGVTTALRPYALSEKLLQLRALNKAADAEITRLVQRQIDAGLDVVSDGELRRPSFLSSFYDATDGLGVAEKVWEIRNERGEVTYTALADPDVYSRLRKASSPLAEESTFLRSITDYPFKVTLPAPSYFYTQFIATPRKDYTDRQQLVDDVVEIERSMVAEAIAAGANWIQFDFPVYPALVDEDYTSKMLKEARLANRDTLLTRALTADREVTRSIPPSVTVGLHLCRGNTEGGFWNGSLAPIAERMFGELPHGRFLVEWENIEREGDYQPIKYVPKGRIMVMGLVSTKKTRIENADELTGRLESAARYLDMGQLALGTQCGFASICGDHLVRAEDVQWRKLEVIGRVADRIWPRPQAQQ